MIRPPHWRRLRSPILRLGWREALAAGIGLVRRHGRGLALLFAGVLLPMWGFAELADEVHEGDVFPFDRPLLELAQAVSNETLDRLFLRMSDIGYGKGVIPASVLLVVALAARRYRRSAFAAIALGGSALLNMATTLFFARERPALWESIVAEQTYSFPSGHAMGSMALATACLLLAWPTKWRTPVVVATLILVPMIGLSRVYLGVHYPSDILAGWVAAAGWVSGCYVLMFGWPRLRRRLAGSAPAG